MITFVSLEAFRAVLLVIGLVSLLVIMWRTVFLWKELTKGPKLFNGSFILIMITTLWDTWDLWRHEHEFSYRSVPYALGVILAFIYILEPKRSYMSRVNESESESESELESEEDVE